MNLKRKAYASEVETLGERQVRVICSTSDVDRAGEIVVQEGIDTSAYMSNPVVLFAHDPSQPIARTVEISPRDGNTTALVQFPPATVSVKADEIYGLVKAGVLNTVSIGFQPLELLAMDPEQPRGPQRYVKSELLEISFVAVPANRGATVVARQHANRAAVAVVKDLYDVGCLASVLQSLGWLRDCAQWEAEVEADGSQVPAMLGEALQQLGAALVAMAEEEVSELLAASLPPEIEVLEDVEASASPMIRKFRTGWRRRETQQPSSGIKEAPTGKLRRRVEAVALG